MCNFGVSVKRNLWLHCLSFSTLVDWSKISRRNLNQSEVKPVVTWSLTFWRHFWFFSVNFEFSLAPVIFPFALIGQSEGKRPVTYRDLVTYILAPFLVFLSKLWFSLVLLIFSFAMIGRWDNFGFCSTSFSQHVLRLHTAVPGHLKNQ